MDKYGLTILLGLTAGMLARLVMLRSDFRHYPGYPHGYVSHISFGFIAAALGAVALPALLEKNFVAVTFLALAAQQFREIRSMERESLGALEETELVPRGKDYIEGIAKVFEARNYLVMGTALATSATNQFLKWPLAIFVAILCIFIATGLMKGQIIGDIADVIPAEISFDNALLKIGNVAMINVGLKKMREKVLEDALGVLIKPKNDNGRATLHNLGQRQAITNVAATILGSKKDIDVPEFTPMIRENVDEGSMALYIVPAEKDIKILIEAVKKTPVLESAKRQPLATKLGKIASD